MQQIRCGYKFRVRSKAEGLPDKENPGPMPLPGTKRTLGLRPYREKTLSDSFGSISDNVSMEQQIQTCMRFPRGPPRGPHPRAHPRGPLGPTHPSPTWPKVQARHTLAQPGPSPAQPGPSLAQARFLEIWKSGNLEMWELGISRNPKNQNSQNQKPFFPKSRQGLDW